MGTDGDRSHRTGTASTGGKAFALLLSIIVGIAGGLLCMRLIGGVPGIVAGALVAALLYFGVGKLLEPRAQLAGVIASDVPDGEAAVVQISEAKKLCAQLESMRASVRDAQINKEIRELIHDITALSDFVERQPSAYRRLSHYLTVYGNQSVSMLRGYMAVESGSGTQSFANAHADALEAFNALEGAAQGELERAMSGKVTELSVGTEAVKRLMEMDGYSTDSRSETSQSAIHPQQSAPAQPSSTSQDPSYSQPYSQPYSQGDAA